jgi:uncharacterized protein YbjT (DUF2867 family)
LVRKQIPTLPAPVKQHLCDFSRLDSLATHPADSVFCALGTTIAKAGSREAFRAVDYDAVLALGRYGRRCGAQRFFLVSSVGASPSSPNFYLRVKGEVERDLAGLGYQALHIFRPSFLMGDRGERRLGESIGIAMIKAAGPALMGPLAQYRGIEAATVARAMVAAAALATAADSGIHVYHYREIVKLAGKG